MPRYKDLTGKQFGFLTVLEYKDNRTYLCRCNCGDLNCAKELLVRSKYLASGKTTTCRRERLDKTVHKAIRYYYAHTRYSATVRGIPFALSLQEFHDIIKQNCIYSGHKDRKTFYTYGHKQTYILIANGIDRVDNTKGYTVDNCVPCCEMCNKAKRDKTVAEFKQWIRCAYEHWAKID